MYRRIPLLFAFALLLVVPLAGCPATGPGASGVVQEGDVVSGTGTIRYFDIEGGFFAIRGDDDKTYDPMNLAEEYQRDGQRVRFRAKLRNDMGSFHMVGPIVEILKIERI